MNNTPLSHAVQTVRPVHRGVIQRLHVLFTAKQANLLLGCAASSLCLALYLMTIAPGVLGGDAGELQFMPYILGLPHPTGYPLQVLLGKLWVTLVPIGSVAYRMNVLSAFAGALAVGFIYGAIRFATASPLAAFSAALLLGLSDIFWGQALIADKYALNAFLLATVLFTLARWSKTRERRDLNWSALCYGISLTHHRSMLIFLPLLVGYWIWRDASLLRQPRSAGRLALFMFLPLLLYLYLPIGASRGLPVGTSPDLPSGIRQPRLPAEWVDYMLDRGFVSLIRPDVGLRENLSLYANTLLAQFTWYGLILGLVGVLRQLQTRDPLALFLIPAFLLQSALSASYQVSRNWVFFLPSFVLFDLWIGAGIAWAVATAATLIQRRKALGYTVTGALSVSFIALVAFLLWKNFPVYRELHRDSSTLDIWRQDLKRGYLAQRFAVNSLMAIEPGSIIAADWEQATPLWYYQLVEGWRPDVTVIHPIERWSEALATGRPTHITRPLPTLDKRYPVTMIGPLFKVMETPESHPPANIIPAEINWEDQIELVGYRFYQTDLSLGRVLPVSLYFKVLQPLTANYSLSVRLFDENGAQLWAEDRLNLALGTAPTTRLLPGEVVGDYFEIPFPDGQPAGRYRVAVIVYHLVGEGQWQNLLIKGSTTEFGYLPFIDVGAGSTH